MNRPSLLLSLRRAADLVPAVKEHLRPESLAVLKAASDMATINSVYHDAITSALLDYFNGGNLVSNRNAFKRACTNAFTDAFLLGYQDGRGGRVLSDTENAWLDARINTEFGYIESLFVSAKEIKADGEADYFAWATARADGYTSTLASLYTSGGLFAKKNQMMTWRLGQTEEHCDTCLELDGQSHRASWYISHDYIPRKPGAGMDCHGYNCDCRLIDKDGNEVTV